MKSIRSYLTGRILLVFLAGYCSAILFVLLLLAEYSLLFTLSVALIAAGSGVIVSYWISRRTSDQVSRPLVRIADIAQAICDGAVSARILREDREFTEAVRAYDSINKLADKSLKDIEEMKRLEKVRSEFLANVSHELRTPIFSIQGFLETLLDGALDDDEVRRQFVEKAHSNTIRLNLLLTDLINISRIESGEMRLSYRYFPILPLIRETARNLEPQARIKNVTLHIQAPEEDDIEVYGDRDRLAQVLTNLIDNAIKYNIESGHVYILLIIQGDEVIVRIRDTGIGISAEHQKRIFERFYRVDKARSRSVGGTGLGLAIVKHILEAHKSAITVESEQGKGTTISFTLKSD